MNILVIGAGGVGASIASIAETRDFFQKFILADVSLETARSAVGALDDPGRFEARRLDARSETEICELVRSEKIDVVVNACDPRLNQPIFQACFTSGATYIDMAMSLSSPHPTNPYNEVGTPLGDDQLAAHDAWSEKGILALVGMGVEPGLSDVFARDRDSRRLESVHRWL
jgi:saccharopine dehydrogenase (NAD+, L-lysine-forming)